MIVKKKVLGDGQFLEFSWWIVTVYIQAEVHFYQTVRRYIPKKYFFKNILIKDYLFIGLKWHAFKLQDSCQTIKVEHSVTPVFQYNNSCKVEVTDAFC